MYKNFDKKFLDELSNQAFNSKRKRAHFNIHKSYSEKIQKVIICILEDSYIAPHFHKYNHQKELFIVLEGDIKIIIFDDSGNINDIIFLGDSFESKILEIEHNVIHTVVCDSPKAYILEIKEGPFIEKESKVFPKWAIMENDLNSRNYLSKLKEIQISDLSF